MGKKRKLKCLATFQCPLQDIVKEKRKGRRRGGKTIKCGKGQLQTQLSQLRIEQGGKGIQWCSLTAN